MQKTTVCTLDSCILIFPLVQDYSRKRRKTDTAKLSYKNVFEEEEGGWWNGDKVNKEEKNRGRG